MTSIPASKFKEQCLALMDHLPEEGLLITKHGKVVAKLVPVHGQGSELIGKMRGKITVHGDLFSTGLKWNAQS